MAAAPMGGALTANPMQQASMAQRGALTGTAMNMAYQPQAIGTNFVAPMVSAPGQGSVPTVSTTGTTPSVTAGQLANTSMVPYMNPYTQNVIGGLQTEAGRAMNIGSNQIGAQATAAGAYGGSRHGVAEGQMRGDVLRGLNQQTGQLMQSGFFNAQQQAQQDIARNLQAQQLNQSAYAGDLARNLQAQGMNQQAALSVGGRDLQAQLANQQAIQNAQRLGSSAEQYNAQLGLAGAQHRLGASGQLANLGQQSFGYGQNIQQQLAQQGAQQQMLNQALIDAAKGQYGAYQSAPVSGLGIMTQALGASPHGQTQTSQRQLGLMDYLTAGASIFAMSDRRLKKNVTLKDILPNGIRVYKWEWNEKAHEIGKASPMVTGVIAQEVAEVFPDAVLMDKSGYLKVNYAHPGLRGAA